MTAYSVGIPAKNEAATIQACIESVYAQTTLPQAVFVCTNGCTDQTPAIVESLKSGFPTLVHLQSKPGKGEAWNEIVRHSKEQFLLFVDADTTINKEAASELLALLSERPNMVLAGGSSIRLPPASSTFFTLISDSVYGIVDTQRFLNGKLYMLRTQALADVAHTHNMPILPADVISDGHYLEKLSLLGGGFAITPKAYSICHPIGTLRDWMIFRLRVSRGRRQLLERYPQLFKDSDFFTARIKNHFHRITVANTLLKKFGAVLFALLREAIQCYAYLEPSKTHAWRQVSSTKKEIIA